MRTLLPLLIFASLAVGSGQGSVISPKQELLVQSGGNPLNLQSLLSGQENFESEEDPNAPNFVTSQSLVTSINPTETRYIPMTVNNSLDLLYAPNTEVPVSTTQNTGESALVGSTLDDNDFTGPYTLIPRSDGATEGTPVDSPGQSPTASTQMWTSMHRGLDMGTGDWEANAFLKLEAALADMQLSVEKLAQDMKNIREALTTYTVELEQNELRTLLMKQYEEMVGLHRETLAVYKRISAVIARDIDAATATFASRTTFAIALDSRISPTPLDTPNPLPTEPCQNTGSRRGTSLRRRRRPRRRRPSSN